MKEKPRVAVLVPGRWHGFNLTRELLAAGTDVRLVTNYPRWKTRQWGIADANVRSLFWHYCLTASIWKAGGDHLDIRLSSLQTRLFSRAAAGHLQGRNIIHAWTGAAWDTGRHRQRGEFKLVLDRGSAHRLEQDRILDEEHRRFGLKFPARPAGAVRRELEEYQHADRIAVPSLFVEKSFRDRGVDPGRLFRNPYGVDLRSFPPAATSPDREFRILFAGALSIQKGVPHLLDAFRQLSVPGASLRLVGGMTREAGVFFRKPIPGVERTGHLPQAHLPGEYQRASVFVMPSVQEGMAMVQLQALASGLPLVCTDRTGGEDLLRACGELLGSQGGIREFSAGFVVPAGDPGALAECLRRLAREPALMERKRSAARAFRGGEFSWTSYAQRTLKLYGELLSS